MPPKMRLWRCKPILSLDSLGLLAKGKIESAELTINQAAKTAGITPVTLIKEPEAAALYSIRRLDAFLDPHDVIVICDAGGGTVDLISYEIEKTEPRLELKEIVPGSGISHCFVSKESTDVTSQEP